MINQSQNMRIVVIEDEGAIREGLVHMIKSRTNYQVVGICKNGLEGIEVVERERPDCIITDIRMEEMDGLEMLQILRDKKIMPYSIILSGYSDFEYARKALRLGAEEYLLKPISIDVLERCLQSIEQKIQKNKSDEDDQLENDIRTYLFTENGESEEVSRAKENIRLHISDTDMGILLTGYYGNLKQDTDLLEHQIKTVERLAKSVKILDVSDADKKMRTLFLLGEEESCKEALQIFVENVAEYTRLKKYGIHWAASKQISFESLKTAFNWQLQCLLDSLAVMEGGMIPTDERNHESKTFLEYPHKLEKLILRDLEEGNQENLQTDIEQFLDSVIGMQYDAKDIRRAVVKLMTKMMDVAKELNQKAYDILLEQNHMQEVLNSYTRFELSDILNTLGTTICEKETKDGISNYIINRTLEYIRMHYKEGITLEETADMLDITPEYLSMLFKREMGMNFSVFLKKFRLSHAKRLLRGTDMKVYEVAEACGYSNSNYFTRVFKEETGISPAEFH